MNAKLNQKQVKFSSAVAQACEHPYDVFGGYREPDQALDVCINCCMDAELEKEMRCMSLRHITAAHFVEYNGSAKSIRQPIAEIKYLLPRLFELIANGADVHHSTVLFLERLGHCRSDAFSVVERNAIDSFALAFFAACLSRHRWRSSDCLDSSDALDFLLMFDIGGIDLQPLLAYWLKTESVTAAMHHLTSGLDELWPGKDIKDAFAKNRLSFQEALKSCVTDPDHRARFSLQIAGLDLSALDEVEIWRHGTCTTATNTADHVFSIITY